MCTIRSNYNKIKINGKSNSTWKTRKCFSEIKFQFRKKK